MSTSEESRARTCRMLGIASLVLGIVALAGRLGYEVASADLGTDLGMDQAWVRALCHLGSLLVAGLGTMIALTALALAPSWRLRLGLPLPGVLVNGMAILWFALQVY